MTDSSSNTTVSVIIPVFNGSQFIGAALDSVFKQTGCTLDVIVVDDGSTDATREIVHATGRNLRFIQQKRQGQSVARNRGVSDASGDFLAFLDADDIWSDGKLLRQLAVLASDAKIDGVFGHVQQFVSPNISAGATASIPASGPPAPGTVPGTLLVRRKAFERIGHFDDRWRAGEFMDWLLRAQEVGFRSTMLPDIVLYRRLHQTNHGIIHRDSQRDYLRILKESLDRRRATPTSHEPSGETKH